MIGGSFTPFCFYRPLMGIRVKVMSEQSIKDGITSEMKVAMKAQDKERLAVIRLILSQFKLVEIEERIDLSKDDTRVLAVLDKMLKQRRDSIEQFRQGGREDLAEKEQAEIKVIQTFMPAPLSDQEIEQAVETVVERILNLAGFNIDSFQWGNTKI